ncbi:MAG TPA: M2 family metallopeptidase [Thermoplasmata archaeon]|nr:M2 family metallopeptidase [Thermoplasmata archaeon]
MPGPASPSAASTGSTSTPAEADAGRFLTDAEAKLLELFVETSKVEWVYNTYITADTEYLSAKANARYLRESAILAKSTVRWDSSRLAPADARKALLLRLGQPLAAPDDPKAAEELTGIVADLQGQYAKGRYTPKGRTEPLDLEALSKILRESRDPAVLLDVWTGWHSVARPMKKGYVRFVELGNQGARDAGFGDLGEMWRAKYDQTPEEFARTVEGLWQQVAPLYKELHAYVRRKLRETHGDTAVPKDGPVPAHLFGNMWAQSWEHLFPMLAPAGSDPGFDLTPILQARKTDPTQMVKFAERFFVSLGLDPLPASFWERSMLARPRDRDVVCHASAWDVDGDNDLRIKMCIDITQEEFHVIHHELGHNYYQRAYRRQPYLFRDGAHDGFHEAVGDTISLSVTPEYLKAVGLIETVPGPEKDLGLLLHKALEKVAFLPFALMIDRWRWDVFSGKVGADDYTRSWSRLRQEYQGIVPPVPRTEEDFDPGAKFHVPANTPYMRYFLAAILQFQFHRGLAKALGWSGPLHRCSIYGQKEAGKRLNAMLEMGASRPWPDALEAVTGERAMDGSAIREYFRPLEEWLKKENRSAPVGW